MDKNYTEKKTIATPGELSVEDVKLLRECCNRFGGEMGEKKLQLLIKYSTKKIQHVKVLIAYHDCLLFLLAYPESSGLLEIARQELQRAATIAKEIYNGNNQRLQTQLSGTGIAHTSVNVAFSFEMAEWLSRRFTHEADILESGADEEKLKEVMLMLLAKSEREAFENLELSISKFIRLAKGKSLLTDLQWLIQLVGNKKLSQETRDELYDSLKLYVSWLPGDEAPSRTFARSLPRKIFFHREQLQRQVNSQKLIGKDISNPVKLSSQEKNHLLEASRGILCMLLRETDPVTYADADAIEMFDMGRGIDIALYPMTADRRLAFDSYIGFTAFKNQLPVAYGGGWIFQHSCRIGVNVLEAYRGGESAYLFCQVLRLYHHHYRVNRFLIEPYQIGYKNNEGLLSGAFWFYYRLGFVPEDDQLKLLAAEEFNVIQSKKGYRSPLSVLKQFSRSNMELVIADQGYQQVEVLKISRAITRLIGDSFSGNRLKAETESVSKAISFLGIKRVGKMTSQEQQALVNFSLLLQLLPGLSAWSNRDKQAFQKLIFLKASGSEREYIQQFQKHRKLNEALGEFFLTQNKLQK